jgi:hypothetical protein
MLNPIFNLKIHMKPFLTKKSIIVATYLPLFTALWVNSCVSTQTHATKNMTLEQACSYIQKQTPETGVGVFKQYFLDDSTHMNALYQSAGSQPCIDFLHTFFTKWETQSLQLDKIDTNISFQPLAITSLLLKVTPAADFIILNPNISITMDWLKYLEPFPKQHSLAYIKWVEQTYALFSQSINVGVVLPNQDYTLFPLVVKQTKTLLRSGMVSNPASYIDKLFFIAARMPVNYHDSAIASMINLADDLDTSFIMDMYLQTDSYTQRMDIPIIYNLPPNLRQLLWIRLIRQNFSIPKNDLETKALQEMKVLAREDLNKIQSTNIENETILTGISKKKRAK